MLTRRTWPPRERFTLFTKALAVQYAKENIRVNSLHPGPIKTPANDHLSDPERLSRVLPLVPMGRVGEAEEVGVCRPLPGFRRVVLRHRLPAAGGRRVDGKIGLSTLVI